MVLLVTYELGQKRHQVDAEKHDSLCPGKVCSI